MPCLPFSNHKDNDSVEKDNYDNAYHHITCISSENSDDYGSNYYNDVDNDNNHCNHHYHHHYYHCSPFVLLLQLLFPLLLSLGSLI